MMRFEFRDGSCYPKALVAVNAALAFVDFAISVVSFSQAFLASLWIGTYFLDVDEDSLTEYTNRLDSPERYFLYFVLTLVAACKNWLCWSNSCGFVVMACPKILFLAAFLLLLSFWVDLCHQSNDDDDEEEGSNPQEALLEKISTSNSSGERLRRFCSFRFRGIHVRSRQKIVMLVTVIIFVLMMATAVLIWIGMGQNPIDSVLVARVYIDVFAVAMLFLCGALACYGSLLSLKMRKVRSNNASSEMLKVAGLTVVSVLCFMSSALVALFTDIPMLYHCHQQTVNGVYTSILLILYYFIGSSVPSGVVLWVMRELPSSVVKQESRTIAFINDNAIAIHPSQHWTTATSLQNQVSRASPI